MGIQWHSMEDLNTYITATITFVSSIRHLWLEKDDEMNFLKDLGDLLKKINKQCGCLGSKWKGKAGEKKLLKN